MSSKRTKKATRGKGKNKAQAKRRDKRYVLDKIVTPID